MDTQEMVQTYRFEQLIFTAGSGKQLPYCSKLTCPEQPGKAALLFLLHGAGERGTDNHSQLIHGTVPLMHYLETRRIKCRLIFPQCPENEQWVDTPWTAEIHTISEQPSGAMSAFMELIGQAAAEPEIDSARIYAVGLSMGGYGVWDFLSRRPDFCTGAVVCCGGADPAMVPRLKEIPLQIFHGDADGAVPVIRSRTIAAELRKAGAEKFAYHEIFGCGHACWLPAFADSCTWDNLFAQRRS